MQKFKIGLRLFLWFLFGSPNKLIRQFKPSNPWQAMLEDETLSKRRQVFYMDKGVRLLWINLVIMSFIVPNQLIGLFAVIALFASYAHNDYQWIIRNEFEKQTEDYLLGKVAVSTQEVKT